jgi:tetratricopeptide (TPR) repeat protein
MRPLAQLHAMSGQFDVARDLLAESSAIHAELGVGLHAAAADVESTIAFLAGDPAGAEAVLRPSLEQLFAMGDRALAATIAGLLARALVEQDRDDEAWELAEIADSTAAADDIAAQILTRTVRGRLLVRRGDLAEADGITAEAVAIAGRTDWLVERADALMARGAAVRACGRPDEADRAFQKAFELYARKGDVVSAERARAVVDTVPAWRAGRA